MSSGGCDVRGEGAAASSWELGEQVEPSLVSVENRDFGGEGGDSPGDSATAARFLLSLESCIASTAGIRTPLCEKQISNNSQSVSYR